MRRLRLLPPMRLAVGRTAGGLMLVAAKLARHRLWQPVWMTLAVITLTAGIAGHLRTASAVTTPRATRAILVLFSGENDGYLEPCGCSSPQIGGLPRRGTVLSGHPQALVLDNGDWIQEPGRQQELKASATVRFFSAFHYAAVNPGELDYALGYAQLMNLRGDTGLPLLSTNVSLQGTAPVFEQSVVVRRQGMRIAVFGEISPSFASAITAVNPMLSVDDPAKALEAAHLRASADASVLLYHGPVTEARDLAQRFPWLSLVITAHDGEDPESSSEPGLAPLASVGQRARYLGRALIQESPGTASRSGTARALPALSLGPVFKDSPAARSILRDYQSKVVAEDLLDRLPRAPLQGSWFAGSASCASCHRAAYRTWKASLHRQAYITLVKAGHGRDPDCVGCHVVGLDRVGGFVSFAKTPGLAEVGCETCHGPQGPHAVGKGPVPPRLSLQMCVDCHTPDQSPRFNLKTYWPRIAH